MDNEVKIFVSTEFGQIRTVEENGKVLFCGRDVAHALGYTRPADAITAHAKGSVKRRLPTNGGVQELKFISEGDVYRLIMHSRLPTAERFESWIFDEVLPTIRRTGGYVSNDDLFADTYLPFADEAIRNLFKLNLQVIRQLNARIEHDQPLVEFANHVADTSNVISMNAMAKLAAQEDIPIGRTRLFRWLRKKRILMANNLPYQKYIDCGYFEVKETVYERNSLSRTYQQTFVTGKGQAYLIKRLRREYFDGCLEEV